ncbi:MAG: hypothetical protein U9N40_04400 [Euryarchaeota archaeon]|nr:hypothetical protein [Euryarchaeota archaeon]
MNEFERNIVHCLNVFFDNNTVSGFSYRLKQAKFNSQYVDVLVDSLVRSSGRYIPESMYPKEFVQL